MREDGSEMFRKCAVILLFSNKSLLVNLQCLWKEFLSKGKPEKTHDKNSQNGGGSESWEKKIIVPMYVYFYYEDLDLNVKTLKYPVWSSETLGERFRETALIIGKSSIEEEEPCPVGAC